MPLTIHFLNVNRGDCILIEFPSRRVGMIDVCDIGILDQDTRKELLAELTSAQKLALNLAESRALFESRVSLEEAYAKRVAAPTTDPVEYFVDNFPGRAIFRLIVTHPHMDHLSGI